MRKTKLHTTTDGFTLIELLLYVALIGIFLSVLSFFFASTASMRVKNQAEDDVNQQAAFVMNLMTQTIRNADGITTPTANNSATSAALTVPTAANSPTIFQLSGSTLQIKEGSAAAVAITGSSVQISNLTFTNTSRASTPGSLQISFTLSATAGSTQDEFNYSRTFTSSASLRP